MNKIIKDLQGKLTAAGLASSVVSVTRLAEVKRKLETLLDKRFLDSDLYDEIISRYGLFWNFEPPASLPTAKSVIITAAQQPKVSLKFRFSGKAYFAIIPPTYISDTDQEAANVMLPYLNQHGYKSCNALVPVKLLAVRSGLAQYGRNNITYIAGWGSYYRLRAFFSDIPCTEDGWHEPVAMERCSTCTACVKKCPTGAISRERFLVNAGACLTFFNEVSDAFPDWIDPAWHNCLIGCMICQDVCPANKEQTSWVMPGGEFSEEETMMILDGVMKNRLPATTTAKLQKVEMLDSYDILARNLRLLIDKEQKSAD